MVLARKSHELFSCRSISLTWFAVCANRIARPLLLPEDGERCSPSFSGKPGMTIDEFRAWRKRLGLTQQRAATELKLRSVRAIKHYEAGTRGISPRIAMLCETVERRWWRGKHRSKGADDFHEPARHRGHAASLLRAARC